MPSIFQLIKGAERKFAPVFKILEKVARGFFCGNKEWKVILKSKATITRCDLSSTILFKLFDSYLIAFKLA